MFLWRRTIELRSNLIEKRYWGMNEQTYQMIFLFLLAIILLEILANVCEKSLTTFFLNSTFAAIVWPQY